MNITYLIIAVLAIVMMSAAGMQSRDVQASTSTFKAWEFDTLGDVLAMSPTKDISGDGIDDVIVTVGQFISTVNGVTGKEIWTYNVNDSFAWIGAVTVDVNNDRKPDVVVATGDGLLILLDGNMGKQIWNFTNDDSAYEPGDACYSWARSLHLVSDIDGDELRDIVVVSGSGDQCPKDDEISVLALNIQSGEKIWQYVHKENYHGLKDGTRTSSPVALIDVNKDGNDDVVIIDDHNILYTVNGATGNVIKTQELDVFGAIWNLMIVSDLSGDGIKDGIAFEFIDGSGGPDYASIDAIDLVSAEVLWRAKVGDGLYDGGALYSMAWLAIGSSAQSSTYIAVTQRIENELELILLDASSGQEVWRFDLGEDRGRNDLAKYYPIAIVPDLNRNGYDEIAIGSISSVIHLLDTKDADILWSHSVNGGGRLITSIPINQDQTYILVADKESKVSALAGLPVIETGLTVDVSEKTIVLSRKVIISGTIIPSLPGEIIQLRYIDPAGLVTSKPLVIARDGSYTDEIEPKVIGSWSVSATFAGKGYYMASQSPTASFIVENETRNNVYMIEVESHDNTRVSYPVEYFIEGGQLTAMSIDILEKSLDIAIKPAAGGGTLKLELPRSVIDAWDSSFVVYIDGNVAKFDEKFADTQKRTLSIPFSGDSDHIRIVGTYVVPEFPTASVMLVLVVISMIIVMAVRNRLFVRYK